MNIIRDIRDRFFERVRTSEMAGPILFAVTIGIVAGFAAVLFRRLIDMVEYLFLGQGGALLTPWIGLAYTIPIIGLGGLLVGLITRYFAPETKGHGVPEVMLAVAREGGRIRARVSLFKILAAALTIGSGGSAGREGPIVQIGATFGSTLAQWFRLPDRRVILSVACGAAGGIAATFNAPMAGVIFAIEVILGGFTALSFGLVVMSSATATVVARSLSAEGDRPAFLLAQEFGMRGLPDLLCFIGLGVLGALVAQLYIRSMYYMEEVADKTPIPDFVKPALGGLAVGAGAMLAPQIMGTGYETIERVLNNDASLLMGTLFLLAFLKIACTVLTIGSGGSGGIFAPSLFIGAMFGGGYGAFMHSSFPAHISSPGAYALIGMAAVFAAAAHAPITAIFILFEMTDEYRIILPLMSATVVSTILSQRMSRDSIYTIKLKRRGIDLDNRPDVNFMDAITVAEAMDEHVEAVPPNMPLSDLTEKLTRRHETGYPVIDPEGHLIGVVTMRDVEEALLRYGRADKLTVQDICTRNVIVCRPDQTLATALSQFGAHAFGRLPVIDPVRPDHVIGILDRQHIIEAYAAAYKRSTDMLPKIDHIESLAKAGRMLIEQATVSAGAALANVEVRAASFPPACTLSAIRRGSNTIVPDGSTRLLPGDQLVVMTTRDRAEKVRAWLREKTQ